MEPPFAKSAGAVVTVSGPTVPVTVTTPVVAMIGAVQVVVQSCVGWANADGDGGAHSISAANGALAAHRQAAVESRGLPACASASGRDCRFRLDLDRPWRLLHRVSAMRSCIIALPRPAAQPLYMIYF